MFALDLGSVPEYIQTLGRRDGTLTMPFQSFVSLSIFQAGLVLALTFAIFNFFLASDIYQPIEAARKIHIRQIHGLMKTDLSTLLGFRPGYVLNRFASDCALHEVEFAFGLADTWQFGIAVLSVGVFAMVSSSWTGVALPFTLIVGILGKKFFNPTSVMLRKMESNTRTPLYAACADSCHVDGIRITRAFGKNAEIAQYVSTLVDTASTPFYLGLASQTWIRFWLAISSSSLAIVLVSVGVAQRASNNSSSIGAALVAAARFPRDVLAFFSILLQLEVSAVAVGRIFDVVELPPEDGQLATSKAITIDSGAIEFRNVSFRYSPASELALKNVSFTVQPGWQVGICGRTGSSKSTLLNALFRMRNLDDGVIVCDGHDTAAVSRRSLRSQMTLIAQGD